MNGSSKSTSVQLSRDELQQLRWWLGGLLTLVSVATVLYFDIAAWILMAVTTCSVIAVMLWPSLPGRVPRWAHRLAFPAIVAIFTADLWLTAELLPALVRLDILLLLYRGITYRQKRDDLQVIVLGLFLVIVAGVLTVSLTFAVHILGFTAGALALLLVVTLTEASAGATNVPQPLGTIPEWARSVDWVRLSKRVWQVTDWRVVTLGSALFAGLVVLSGFLFIAIPRFQLENGLFLERFITKKARTGFSDSIKFGDVTEIQQDNAVALSVDVSDRSQIPAAPYWRMLVLDEYRDGGFRLSPALQRSGFAGERRGRQIAGAPRGRHNDQTVWRFYLESGVSRYLPLLGNFESLRFTEPQRYRWASAMSLVSLRDEPVTMIAYRVEGMVSGAVIPDAKFGALLKETERQPASAGALMLGLQLREDDQAALSTIVDAILSGAPLSAADYSQRAKAWLAERHSYSLKPSIPAGTGDPLIRWINSREGGHCELFAGSLVVLARAAGLPARMVTGFYGGSWNGFSDNFTLRNSDAHAWCEIFDVTTQSWLRVDPTPGTALSEGSSQRGEAAISRRLDRSWKARLESLRVFWYRQIVNFDQRSQMEALNTVKEASENSSRRVRASLDRWGQRIRSWLATPWDVRRIAGFVSILALLVVGGIVAVHVHRFFKYRSWRSSRHGSADVVRAEAGKWLVRFSKHPSVDGETTQRQEVIEELQRIRFGRKETWSDVAPVLRRARNVWRQDRKRRAGEPRNRDDLRTHKDAKRPSAGR